MVAPAPPRVAPAPPTEDREPRLSLGREQPAPRMLVPVPKVDRVVRLEVSIWPELLTPKLPREDNAIISEVSSSFEASTLNIPPEASPLFVVTVDDRQVGIRGSRDSKTSSCDSKSGSANK